MDTIYQDLLSGPEDTFDDLAGLKGTDALLRQDSLDQWLNTLTADPFLTDNSTSSPSLTDAWSSSSDSSPARDFQDGEIEDLVDFVLGNQDSNQEPHANSEEDDSTDDGEAPGGSQEESPVVGAEVEVHSSLGDHDYFKHSGAADQSAQIEAAEVVLDTKQLQEESINEDQQIKVATKYIAILPAAQPVKTPQISLVRLASQQQSASPIIDNNSTATNEIKVQPTLVYNGRKRKLGDGENDVTTPRPSKSYRSYPALILTDEEKRMCEKDGIVLPKSYPLTKSEEANLKKIRRKIRNKISAQSSRRRKKDYVDDMEARAINSETENKELKRKVATLESQNKILMNQLKRMQSLIVRKNPGQKSATALMVLLLSTALFMVPGFKEYQNGKPALHTESKPTAASFEQQAFTAAKSRSLLHFIEDNIKGEESPVSKVKDEFDSSFSGDNRRRGPDHLAVVDSIIRHPDEVIVKVNDGYNRPPGDEDQQQQHQENRTKIVTAGLKSFAAS